MIGRAFLGIIAFILLVSFSGAIADGVKGWRTDTITESEASVVTGAGETTANVTLDRELYQNSVVEVIAISSNVTESPVASTYTSATQVLLVSALDTSTTRTLTLNYYSELEDTVMQAIGAFILFAIFGGCAGAILWGIFKPSKGRR